MIVGVNAFQVDEPEPPQIFQVKEGAAARQIAKLEALRTRRDGTDVARRLDELRAACRGDENTMPATIAAVKAFATIGEIAAVWREVFGEYASQSVTL